MTVCAAAPATVIARATITAAGRIGTALINRMVSLLRSDDRRTRITGQLLVHSEILRFPRFFGWPIPVGSAPSGDLQMVGVSVNGSYGSEALRNAACLSCDCPACVPGNSVKPCA